MKISKWTVRLILAAAIGLALGIFDMPFYTKEYWVIVSIYIASMINEGR